jgi:hypothetical protein
LTAFTVSANTLLSGNGDVTIVIDKALPDSDNLLFEPIPNELLYTYS